MLRSASTKTLKIWIIVLSVLLAGCAVALIVTGVKNGSRHDSGTVTLPENLITSGGIGTGTGMNAPGATLIKPGTGGKEVNTPFCAEGMMPGDSETRYFCVRISGKEPMALHFRTQVREGGEALAAVLNVRVALLGTETVLYEGLIRDMPELTATVTPKDGGSTDVYYEVTATLSTSVGNEFQNAALTADFHWSAEGTGGVTPDHNADAPDTAPVSAGAVVGIVLASVAVAGGIAFLIVVWIRKRKKGAGQ